MLAIYLASPEVENDRRSLNVFNKAMQMMLDGEIDAGEYRAIKSRYEQANYSNALII